MKTQTHRMFDKALLGWLYLFEGAGLLAVVSYCRLGDRILFQSLWTRPGEALLFAVPLVVAGGIGILHRIFCGIQRERRTCVAAIGLNAFTLVLLFVPIESAVRIASVSTPAGPKFREYLLLPRSWNNESVHLRDSLREAREDSIIVYDEELGWTVGKNRRSKDGLYSSSMEGIRSSKPGMVFPNDLSVHRIALVGDSFTFALNVTYEESWGVQLEKRLGPKFQVLNWGVPGFGVDQAYLRYLKDVRPWRPQVVLFGIHCDDLLRSMLVYPFIRSPEWYPFSKPRFALQDHQLKLLNAPAIQAEKFTFQRSILELPFVQYDPFFKASDWKRRPYEFSFFARYLFTRFSPSQTSRERAAEQELRHVNGAILRAFIDAAVADGSIPILVFLPYRGEIGVSEQVVQNSIVPSVLREFNLPFVDLSACLAKVPEAARFAPGGHYSAQSCFAIAEELQHTLRIPLETSRKVFPQ